MARICVKTKFNDQICYSYGDNEFFLRVAVLLAHPILLPHAQTIRHNVTLTQIHCTCPLW